MADADGASDVLVAPLTIEYPFRRTTGPVLGAFFTALREGFVVGIRAADGRVLCPPQEYDPLTAEPLTEVVEVGDAGEVVTAAWNPRPLADQPLASPFAWALIKLDGADTALLHAVDSGGTAPVPGTRVKARWRAAPDRAGSILDIECFEPEA
jgi:uncharacterized OB-fold protein